VKIWKFPFVDPAQPLELPRSSAVLHVREQGGVPTIWAEVDPSGPTHPPRLFVIAGTGHDAPDGDYAGTCFCGPFVWHVYEEPDE
jgi:hypothetical protein